jgi:AraC-like DNA-binding protein
MVSSVLSRPSLRQEQATLWRDPHLDDMELLSARYVTHAFAPHAHETFALGVVVADALSFSYRREKEIIAAGEVMVINPHELHTGHAVGAHGCAYRMLYPSQMALQTVSAALTGRFCRTPFFPTSRIQDAPLAQLVLNLHLALQGAATPRLEREARLLDVLTWLIERHAAATPAPDPREERRPGWIAQAVDYIEAHFAEDVSLAQIAATVNVSPFHLLRAFRAEMGAPPHTYLNQIRIRHAKRLLLCGQPIVQVAAETGFADQSHLTRRFRQVVGTTPRQYQQIGMASRQPGAWAARAEAVGVSIGITTTPPTSSSSGSAVRSG